jgi:hypothetical protein
MVLSLLESDSAFEGHHECVAALTSFLARLEIAISGIDVQRAAMQTRAARALSRVCCEGDRLMTALQHVILARTTAASALYHRIDDKLLDERVEEAEANARLLDAVAMLCTRACCGHSSLRADVFSLRVDNLQYSFLLRCADASDVVMVRSELAAAPFSTWCTAWRDGVDASMSKLSGGGLIGFVTDASAFNQIRLLPRIATGDVAEFVTAADVSVRISDSLGMDTRHSGPASRAHFETTLRIDSSSHEVTIAYMVPRTECSHSLDLCLTVCGETLWHGVVPLARVAGRHKGSLAISPGEKHSIVVTSDLQFMAVSYTTKHQVFVYRLDVLDGVPTSATLLHKLGSCVGGSTVQFKSPARMCLSDAGNLLVCEPGNDRVQELSRLCEAASSHLRFIQVPRACAVAVYGNVLAVGTINSTVVLLDYTTCDVLHTIGAAGCGPGHIGNMCTGLRFTADGSRVLVAEYANNRLSLFRVADGSFESHAGAGLVFDGCKDIEITQSGEILAQATTNRHVSLLSSDGSAIVRSWDGSRAGKFQVPTALALVRNVVFVLDRDREHVQLFD